MSKKSRAYTEEETRELFLEHVRNMAEYWNQQKCDRKYALDGLAFSILTALDGEVIDLPGFRVSPICGEEDKQYYKSVGEKYFDEAVDIAGSLHEEYHK